MACPGSVALSANLPDKKSVHAQEGTTAHELGADLLEDGIVENAEKYPLEMVEHIKGYVNAVMAHVQPGDILLVEQRVPIDHITGEHGASGTSDAIVIKTNGALQSHDLKYGMGIQVYASERVDVHDLLLTAEGAAVATAFGVDEGGTVELPNPQLGLYTLGGVRDWEIAYEFDRVELFIHQPRLDHISEFACTLEQLRVWGEWVKAAAKLTRAACDFDDGPIEEFYGAFFNPGEKQCRWCRAKAKCEPLRRFVAKAVSADFDDKSETPAIEQIKVTTPPPPDELGGAMAKVDLVEDWCRGVRAAVETQLAAGKPVAGWKLVEGRKGARKWTDEKSLVKLARRLKISAKKLWEKSLISPTTAEKMLKKTAPEAWTKLQDVITQPTGKPSVAPAKDPRPAYTPAASAEDFATHTED